MAFPTQSRRKIFYSVYPVASGLTPAPLKAKANDPAVTKVKTDLANTGSFWGSITVTIRKVLVGATVPLWKATVMCQSRNLQRLHSRKRSTSCRTQAMGLCDLWRLVE